MRLKKILENVRVEKTNNFKNYNIKCVTHNSNDVIKDSVFICIKGEKYNGEDYIADAINRGAKCIITENDIITSVTTIVVKDIRIAMSTIAKNFYNRCCDDLDIIGVVGTSGKTSTAMIISHILKTIGKNVGIIGTNFIYFDNIRQDSKFTTPDPLDLHYIFYQMKMLGIDTVVMEISAQAIYYKKVYGIRFRVVDFTNISPEHIDFFGTYEKYIETKLGFFIPKNMDECVVNIDDVYGRELAYNTMVPSISYGLLSPANSFALDISESLDGLEFTANILDDIIPIKCCLVGGYNVYNILGAMSVCKLLGVSAKSMQMAINCMPVIDGRFNVYSVGGKRIIIDFAHTPDSIEKVLSFIRVRCDKKLIVVFGCVGYSDREKRITMTSVVSKYADNIIITTDNPGNTPFEDIAKDMMIGASVHYECVEDRESAIKYAYQLMDNGDTLVVLGKGAENFQTIGDERREYSDTTVVKKLIGK